MRVWLVTIGEPLPTDPGQARLLRCGILARQLAAAGHDVLWWTSAFDHVAKRHRSPEDRRVPWAERLELWLLHGPGYQRNISLERIRDHRVLARKFAVLAAAEPRPDIVLASFPPIELCLECCRYGREAGVPVVLDVRDLWPDTFLDHVPGPLRWLGRLALAGMFRDTRRAFRMASAVIGITPRFVAWGLAKAGRPSTDRDRDFPMGYPRPDFDPADMAQARRYWSEEHGLRRDEAQLAVFFGSLGHQFDLEPVLQAARDLKHEGHRFVICGTGERLEEYRRRARDLPNVLLPGWVQAPQIAALMEIADVGLAPYLDLVNFQDNYPNKLIEYFSGGLPVVASLGGLVGDLLREYGCGVTYCNTDPGSLTRALRELSKNTERRQVMSDNARRLYLSRFDAADVYNGLVRSLEALAAGSHEALMETDYAEVTEVAGDEVSVEQIERLCRRYYWAGHYCEGRRVLEVACGSGQGLGYLAGLARETHAGDISETLVERAKSHYGGRLDIRVMDAMNLPFADASLDVVILFEAIYYLPDAGRFVDEAARVLAPGGHLLIATANKDLYDFNPSPHSQRYYGVAELGDLLASRGFACEFHGDTPLGELSLRQRLLRPIKSLAVKFHLVPGTMAGKKLLKRLVFGALRPMPAEIDARTAPALPPTPIPAGARDVRHKVIYCAARKP